MAPHSAHLSVLGCSICEWSALGVSLGILEVDAGVPPFATGALDGSDFGASAAFGSAAVGAGAGAAAAGGGAGCDTAGLADDTRAGGTTGVVGPTTDFRNSSSSKSVEWRGGSSIVAIFSAFAPQ